MPHVRLTLFAAALPLAACNSQPEVKAENASMAEVSKAIGDAARMQPGKWRTEVTIENIDMPGAPPRMTEMLKKQMASSATQSVETCVTKEQSERPPEKLFGGMEGCRYETFRLGGGRLDAVMSCQGGAMGPGSGGLRSTLSGDFGDTGYDLASTGEMQSGEQKIAVKSRIKGSRIGECTG